MSSLKLRTLKNKADKAVLIMISIRQPLCFVLIIYHYNKKKPPCDHHMGAFNICKKKLSFLRKLSFYE
ncbi:MAG: hypothetical protein B6245_11465 [Desulfobacteraceae bacterium 4572_88]|nr:MAG: hypothetical protein B6245_11465 [Desulfobacteraceae bacterium 4572_88]